jgi:hypothetical protein
MSRGIKNVGARNGLLSLMTQTAQRTMAKNRKIWVKLMEIIEKSRLAASACPGREAQILFERSLVKSFMTRFGSRLL